MSLLNTDNADRILSKNLLILVPTGSWASRVILSDTQWQTVPLELIVKQIALDDRFDPANYIEEVFDCDDFAITFKSKMALYAATNKLKEPLAVGFICTKQHAFNFFIDETRSFVLIDTRENKPQKCPTGLSPPAFFKEQLNLDEGFTGNQITLIYL